MTAGQDAQERDRTGAATPGESAHLDVVHLEDTQFLVRVRGHSILVDRPLADGGTDIGPTPTELLVAGLASSVAEDARDYLRRAGLSSDGFEVHASCRTGGTPERVTVVDVTVTPPRSLPAEQRAQLQAAASHCTVHASLEVPPHVSVRLAEPLGDVAEA